MRRRRLAALTVSVEGRQALRIAVYVDRQRDDDGASQRTWMYLSYAVIVPP
jgi:hypothetical protein